MILSFHPCFDADIQIILGDRPLDKEIQESIRKADAILLPQACTQRLYQTCALSAARLFPNYDARIRYPGKIGQARLFRALNFPHPRTVSWKSVEQFKGTPSDPTSFPLKPPFLIKEDRRHEAEGIFLIENSKELKIALSDLSLRERSGQKGFVTQEYIPCGGNVLRTVIIGTHLLTYWKRPREPGQKITTISRGAIIDPDWALELQEKGRWWVQELSEKTGINLAAVDFVFPLGEKDPEPFFLEINYYFGRKGLGGSETYYRLLHGAIRKWLHDAGTDPGAVRLV